nr:response regulator [Thioalkalivibrio sp.]
MSAPQRQIITWNQVPGPARLASSRQQVEEVARARMPARAVVVDDHPLFRRAARDLMERGGGFRVVGEAGSGREGLELAFALQPDLVLLDVRLGDMDGIGALRRLREAGVGLRVAVITASRDPAHLQAALRAGADGYLLKNAEPHALLAQLRRVVAGQLVLAEGLGESLARSIRDDGGCVAMDLVGLTSRERQILECIAAGHSNRKIAAELQISDATVKVHVKHLLKKLGLHSRVEAALWCLEQRRRRSF